MTERGLPIVDGAPACPFVAFADDRDERATSPDHRHRCYAEVQPAQRALAHQEAYCLSSAFPVCPTFQDWARREAARARASTGAAAPPPTAPPPQRNVPRDWSAPPAWSGASGAPPTAAGPGASSRPAPGSGAGAGAGAGAAAGAGAGAGAGAAAGAGATLGAFDDEDILAPDFLSSRSRPAPRETPLERAADSPPAAPRRREERDRDDRYDDRDDGDVEDWEAERTPSRGRREPSDRGSGFVLGGDRRPKVGDTRRRREPEPGGPSWERPRRNEAYPTLKSRVGLPSMPSIPRVGVMALALVVAAIGLFFLPALLGMGRNTGPTGVGGSPGASVRPSVAASPTATPAPTPQIYLVASGDTMSSIAADHGVSLQELIDANRETIPNPDSLQIGDRVTIPTRPPDEIPGASASPSALPPP